jgi:Tfp pilus assembly protein PilF
VTPDEKPLGAGGKPEVRSQKEVIEDHCRRAVDYMRQGNLDASVEEYRKALELDPQIGEAHALLGSIYQKQWRWSDAEAQYQQALALNPNDATAVDGMAIWLLCQGRTKEAMEWAQRARSLDPLGIRGETISWILFHSRRYDEAIRELHSILAVNPNNAQALWDLGFVLVSQNKSAEAIPFLEKAAALRDRSPGSIDLLAAAYAGAGRRSDALLLIDELKQRQRTGYVPAGAFVIAYLGLGNHDEAFVWIERAYQEQSNILQLVKVHPVFDPIRSDPRFIDLVKRVGLS